MMSKCLAFLALVMLTTPLLVQQAAGGPITDGPTYLVEAVKFNEKMISGVDEACDGKDPDVAKFLRYTIRDDKAKEKILIEKGATSIVDFTQVSADLDTELTALGLAEGLKLCKPGLYCEGGKCMSCINKDDGLLEEKVYKAIFTDGGAAGPPPPEDQVPPADPVGPKSEGGAPKGGDVPAKKAKRAAPKPAAGAGPPKEGADAGPPKAEADDVKVLQAGGGSEQSKLFFQCISKTRTNGKFPSGDGNNLKAPGILVISLLFGVVVLFGKAF